MTGTPLASRAPFIVAASSSEVHIGFSDRIALPACAAATMAGVCRWWGRQMSTASTSGSCSRAAMSSYRVAAPLQKRSEKACARGREMSATAVTAARSP
jgi:hypothetical protein